MRDLYAVQVAEITRGFPGTGIAPSGKLTVMVGDVVKVTFSLKYRGKAISGKIHVTFGQKDTFFNEDGNKQIDASVNFGPDNDFKTYTFSVNVPINGNTGTNYDLYAKLMSLPGVTDIFTPTYLNVLDVLGSPEFQDFKVTDYSKV